MRRWTLALCSLAAGLVVGATLGRPLLIGQPPPVPEPVELISYRDAVKKVLPAVVSIEAKGIPSPARGVARPRDSGENVLTDVGFGSGVLVDPDGVVLTNYHVVKGGKEFLIQLHDGSKYRTTDLLADPKTDVAVLRFKADKKLPALALGDSAAMEIGDRVLAIGAPFGLTGSVTHGIISAKGRALQMNMYEDFVQTDAAVNPGNSGGPLVNLRGEVIGINAVIKSRTGGFQGVGLAISSRLAKRIVAGLLRDGVIRRGYLGAQVTDITDPAAARKLGLATATGVQVGEVFPDTPAAKGGLLKGDVITAIAGKPVKDGQVMQALVADAPLNEATEITILRDGRAYTVRVTIEEQPGEFGSRRRPDPPAPEERPPAVDPG